MISPGGRGSVRPQGQDAYFIDDSEHKKILVKAKIDLVKVYFGVAALNKS